MSAMSRTAVAVLFFTVALTVACGGGGSSSSPAAPVFSLSTPSAASEGAQFTYTLQASDPKGGSVTFALVSGPAGATLSGATISWTPTHAQSRRPNEFTVKATSASGASATASFTVTPSGTINGSDIATYWSGGQGTQVPLDFSRARALPSALVPDGMGGMTTYAGQGFSDGTFKIPNVPAGSYWLKFGTAMYWTDASDLDLGRDLAGRPRSGTYQPPSAPVAANLDISGLDPWNGGSTPIVYDTSTLSGFSPEAMTALSFTYSCTSTSTSTSCTSNPGALGAIPSGVTSFTGQLPMSATLPVESALGDSAYFFQADIVPTQGTTMGVSRMTKLLGPLSLTLDSNVTSLDISGQFTASPQNTMRLKVRGAGFASSVLGTNPNAVIDFMGLNALASSALVPDRYAPGSSMLPLGLEGPPLTFRRNDPGVVLVAAHTSGQPTDYDGGDITFINPLPNGVVVYRAEQNAAVFMGQFGTTNYYMVGSTGYYTTKAPAVDAPFDAPMLNVQDPQINGIGLFQATTAVQPITLTWRAPVGLSPSGYIINAIAIEPCTGTPTGGTCVGFSSPGILYTSGTSVTFPSGFLTDGKSYIFEIQAWSDKATNFLNAPNRGSWERAYSETISNLIAVGSTAPAAVARVLTVPASRPTRAQFTRVIGGTLHHFCYVDGKPTNEPCVK
jgi:hypothetical protein